MCFTIKKKKKKYMYNLHFIPNNIFKFFFKKLTKYKNDYHQYLNFIYRNYIMYLIIYLYIYPCIYIRLQASNNNK